MDLAPIADSDWLDLCSIEANQRTAQARPQQFAAQLACCRRVFDGWSIAAAPPSPSSFWCA
jgi:hypothetical protein